MTGEVMAVSDAAARLPGADVQRTVSTRPGPALPTVVIAAGAVVGIASSQGGYFPTSWGLSGTLLLWATGLWLALSARTDAGRYDAAFLGFLAAFMCWIGLSIVWSEVPGQSVLDLERTLVLLAGVTAVLAVAKRAHAPRLAAAVLASIVAVSAYALATRLFPDHLGRFDPIAGYRLADPLGYWNSLGVFTVMGILLALGFVSDARSKWTRAAAGGTVVVLMSTLYFTFSRASWIGLGLGICVLLVLSPRRLRTIASGLVVVIPSLAGVAVASTAYALTHDDAPLAEAASAGHRYALGLLLLTGLTVALVLALDAAERRIAVPSRFRLALGAALLIVTLLPPVAIVVRAGGPIAVARNAWSEFSSPSPATGGDLNRRLFNFAGSGRVEHWRTALDVFEQNPVRGNGAGTFERRWQAREDAPFKVRDAHSLYLETLAELGVVGLGLLVLMLLVPLVAGLTVRRQPYVPAAVAAFVAFAVHAGVDWDWELSGVTLTALLIAAVCIVSARRRGERTLGARLRLVGSGAVLVASLATMGIYLGNGALDRAQRAVSAGNYADAVEEARRAERLLPWSPWPLIARGDAQLAAGLPASAKESYREAIAIDSGEWRAWYGLGLASNGTARTKAFARAHRLYPQNLEVSDALAARRNGTNG